MPIFYRFLAVGFLAAAGCEACGAADDPGTTTPEPSAARSEETPVEEPVPPSEPPDAVVRLELDTHAPCEISVIVESRGDHPANLSTRLRLERRTDGQWSPVEAGLRLRSHCEAPVPDCIELVRGAEFLALPFRGQLPEGQCECDGCDSAPDGEYRVAVSSCDGQHRLESQSFTVHPQGCAL